MAQEIIPLKEASYSPLCLWNYFIKSLSKVLTIKNVFLLNKAINDVIHEQLNASNHSRIGYHKFS